MLLGVLSAVALSIGIASTANDVMTIEEADGGMDRPVVEVEQVRHGVSFDEIEIEG